MRTMNLNEMEQINGGKCDGAVEEASFAVSGSSLIFAVAAVAALSNPIGWGMLAMAATSMALSAASCAD